MIKIYSAPIRSGKTKRLFQNFGSRSDVGGFLSPDIEEQRKLLNLQTKEHIDFQTDGADKNCITVGRFHFLLSAFIQASNWTMAHALNKEINIIIIDEVGKLELQEKGFDTLVMTLLHMEWTKRDLILVVRDFLVDDVITRYGIIDVKVIQHSPIE